MEAKNKKSFNHYIRALHRDIGFFVIGLTVVFCASGIVLIFRDTDFLIYEKTVEKQIEPNLESSELGKELRLRNIGDVKVGDEVISFDNGTYNRTTGKAVYTIKELPSLFRKLNTLHKAPSGNWLHWFSMIYGILLLFLALSSFWMYKPNSKLFKRGIIITCTGLLVAALLLII